MMAISQTTFAGKAVQARAQAPRARVSTVVRAQAGSRRELLSLGLAAAVVAATAGPAKADLVEDLKAKSEANKAKNDKARLAASSRNLERSRAVADGVCAFPANFTGCGDAISKKYSS
ncbi:unnamed protein product [Pedinophyceae sp. YPF-701]|nr:unnamed protein product [Pedinophyceae sp. YPF-701]